MHIVWDQQCAQVTAETAEFISTKNHSVHMFLLSCIYIPQDPDVSTLLLCYQFRDMSMLLFVSWSNSCLQHKTAITSKAETDSLMFPCSEIAT